MRALGGALGGWLAAKAEGIRTLATFLGLIGALAGILFLGSDLADEIEAQRTASSDNTRFAMAQLEVEYLRYINQLIVADTIRGHPPDLVAMRETFDVFYSRVNTISTGGAYARLREDAVIAEALETIRAELDDQIPLIDSEDAMLARGLGELLTHTRGLGPTMRALSLQSLVIISGVTEEARLSVNRTLMTTGLTTLTLLGALAGGVFWLRQLGKRARRHAAEALAELARNAAILQSSMDAIVTCDEAGHIISFSGSAETLFDRTTDEMKGRNFESLLANESDKMILRTWRSTLARRDGSGAGRLMVEAKTADGRAFPAEISLSLAAIGAQSVMVCFLRDISEEIAQQEALRDARDKALVGERTKANLLAVMSHEMRTPLNGLLGTLDLLGDTNLSPEQRRFLRNMTTSGRLLLSHVNDVLDITRLDAGMVNLLKEPFDLKLLIDEVVEGLEGSAAKQGNRITVSLDPDLAPTRIGDPVRLSQILMNLAGNAVKFTQNGLISIDCEPAGTGDMVEIRVSDTGIGMSADSLSQVFEDFVTLDNSYARKFGGTGLGLGIVRRLTLAMGGELGVESEPGEGTLFWLRLPLPSAPPEALGQGPAEMVLPGSRPRDILVIEDNEINRAVVSGLLNKLGHQVTLACDGEEGVATAQSRRFDLILTDISMPRMDGVEATREIRRRDGPNRKTPIFALTAQAMPDEIARFYDAGMEDVLNKPLSRDSLARALARLDGREATAPVAPPPEVERPVVDDEVLLALFDDLGAERAGTILRSFLSGTAPDLRLLVEAAAEARSDDAELIGVIHRLAGGAALVGAAQLAETLRRLERLGKTGEISAMRMGARDLTAIWEATTAAMAPFAEDQAA